MDPKQFWWSEDQTVTVTNPTEEKYRFKVHSKDYELGAGQTAKMPGYIAWVYVYGLATQLCQADGLFARWNEEEFRQEYYQKIVAGTDDIVQAVAVEPEPVIETLDTPVEPDNSTDDEEGDEEPVASTTKVAPMKPEAKVNAGSAKS